MKNVPYSCGLMELFFWCPECLQVIGQHMSQVGETVHRMQWFVIQNSLHVLKFGVLGYNHHALYLGGSVHDVMLPGICFAPRYQVLESINWLSHEDHVIHIAQRIDIVFMDMTPIARLCQEANHLIHVCIKHMRWLITSLSDIIGGSEAGIC